VAFFVPSAAVGAVAAGTRNRYVPRLARSRQVHAPTSSAEIQDVLNPPDWYPDGTRDAGNRRTRIRRPASDGPPLLALRALSSFPTRGTCGVRSAAGFAGRLHRASGPKSFRTGPGRIASATAGQRGISYGAQTQLFAGSIFSQPAQYYASLEPRDGSAVVGRNPPQDRRSIQPPLMRR